jgi:hypothetical protein
VHFDIDSLARSNLDRRVHEIYLRQIHEDDWQVSVFVYISELIQKRESFAPSIAWLKAVDRYDRSCAKSTEILPSPIPIHPFIIKYRELIDAAGNTVVRDDELPDGVVKGRSIVVEHVPNESVDIEGDRGRLGRELPNMLTGLFPILIRHARWMRFDELADKAVKGLAVFLRSGCLGSYANEAGMIFRGLGHDKKGCNRRTGPEFYHPVIEHKVQVGHLSDPAIEPPAEQPIGGS